MIATLKILREKYGGAEGYLKGHTKLTNDDLEKIRGNFLVTKSA